MVKKVIEPLSAEALGTIAAGVSTDIDPNYGVGAGIGTSYPPGTSGGIPGNIGIGPLTPNTPDPIFVHPSQQQDLTAMASTEIRTYPEPLMIHKTMNGWLVETEYPEPGSIRTFQRTFCFTDIEQLNAFIVLHYAGLVADAVDNSTETAQAEHAMADGGIGVQLQNTPPKQFAQKKVMVQHGTYRG